MFLSRIFWALLLSRDTNPTLPLAAAVQSEPPHQFRICSLRIALHRQSLFSFEKFSVMNDVKKRSFRLRKYRIACPYRGKCKQNRRRATNVTDAASPLRQQNGSTPSSTHSQARLILSTTISTL